MRRRARGLEDRSQETFPEEAGLGQEVRQVPEGASTCLWEAVGLYFHFINGGGCLIWFDTHPGAIGTV